MMSTVEIPAGLKELLQGYTVEVLRRRPPNLAEFAVQHFTRILESQRNDQQDKKPNTESVQKEVTFESDTDEPNKHEEEEEEEEEEPVPVSEYLTINTVTSTSGAVTVKCAKPWL